MTRGSNLLELLHDGAVLTRTNTWVKQIIALFIPCLKPLWQNSDDLAE